MNGMMVSIIVPVYNMENYLKKCLESIRNQTYSYWECILVDDGSTDLSPMICDEYEKLDKRFKVLHQKNAGLSVARNIGIELAKGEYLMFVDSDDWIEADAVEGLLNLLRSSDSDISCGNHNRLDEVRVEEKEDIEIISPQECMERLFSLENSDHTNLVASWGKMYKIASETNGVRAKEIADFRLRKSTLSFDLHTVFFVLNEVASGMPPSVGFQ